MMYFFAAAAMAAVILAVFCALRMRRLMKTDAAQAETPAEPAPDVDLTAPERPTVAVKLPPDGRVLHLRTPTKGDADRFRRLIAPLERDGAAAADMQMLYAAASLILSTNTEGVGVSAEQCQKDLSRQDCETLFAAYLTFLQQLIDQGN